MMKEFVAFETVVYKASVKSIKEGKVDREILKTLDVVCDKYVEEAKKIAQESLDKRYKKFGIGRSWRHHGPNAQSYHGKWKATQSVN